ncbi:hypothetical protein QRZ28_26340 [Raoultella ornithinolytica]|uniref:hypothetical protein n=1 Tax=Raoultella ornithinolytica TaxID=54291 RepID=UPI00255B0524|nr:hypothetical protein [Raoultella ornithinolytica]MDL4585369.1 hypothetical protein [Raoultella ornithinolytica]HEC2564932.1 hypothetical protein [Raoultella ornithinolytica]
MTTLLKFSFLFISLLMCIDSYACTLTFQKKGSLTKYTYNELPKFIVNEIRPAVSKVPDTDRYSIYVRNECKSDETEKSTIFTFSVQRNTVYLKAVNDVLLCVPEYSTEKKRFYCDQKQYDYESYKGGNNSLYINELVAKKYATLLSKITSKSQLIQAWNSSDSTDKNEIENAVRTFAMLLAESTRFDNVLNDLTCSIQTQESLFYMKHWILYHNWGTITQFITDHNQEELNHSGVYLGAGKLFVPVTNEMVKQFDKDLIEHPENHEDKSSDGKNYDIPTWLPACQI